MPGLKVVALISGGKDSFFSILHCQANGHEVVALANLHPPIDNGAQSEDIDSFMYQTIGHSVIPLYEKALGLPLYRQEILGSAVDQNKSYATPTSQQATGDETESLLPLLQKVLAQQPDVTAVSTGAILSDYQRTRVESIAIRLGLVPLSYLWHYPFLPPYSETSLLDDMMAVEQDARIIKVASGGLDDSFLWENVAAMRTKSRLIRATERFGVVGDGAALGEGGEFETLAIDGPSPLWKNSIEVTSDDMVITAGEAGSASVKIKYARLVPKETTVPETTSLSNLRRPPLFDHKFEELREKLVESSKEQIPESPEPNKETDTRVSPAILTSPSRWLFRTTSQGRTISNATAEGTTAGEQMQSIMKRLVKEFKITPSYIAYTTILLRNMSDFGAVNAAYGAMFTTPSPPARVTIACGDVLSADALVCLSVLVLAEESQKAKQGLHVQSRSYWAPANIGPYSQAISIPTGIPGQEPSVVYVAGQIPLSPASMDFPPKAALDPLEHFQLQTSLSLQHLWRIGQVMKVDVWHGAVAFISKQSHISVDARVRSATKAWKLAHTSTHEQVSDEEEDGDVDVWDMVHGRNSSFRPSGATYGGLTKRDDIQSDVIPLCFVAEVETLPRDAPIEWASIGLTACRGKVVLHDRPNSTSYQASNSDPQVLTIHTSKDSDITIGWISIKHIDDMDAPSLLSNVTQRTESTVYTIYTTGLVSEQVIAACAPQIIPCHRIWGADGNLLAAVVSYRVV